VTDLDVHLEAIAAGDAAAFARWLAAAEPALRPGLRRFAAVCDTEAVLQEALLRVWQVAPRFVRDGRDNGLLRLAARIARNRALSEARRAGVVVAQGDDVPEVPITPALPDPALAAHIAGCREALPPAPARVFSARLEAGGGEPDAALAERLGMRLNTFLQNAGRARKLLASCLERAGITLAELSR